MPCARSDAKPAAAKPAGKKARKEKKEGPAMEAALPLLSLLGSVNFAREIVPDPKATFYITTAINYANGAPHMGHAYEALVTDVVARYHRLSGKKLCGNQPVSFEQLRGRRRVDGVGRLKFDFTQARRRSCLPVLMNMGKKSRTPLLHKI